MESAKDTGKNVEMNKHQKALDGLVNVKENFVYHEGKMIQIKNIENAKLLQKLVDKEIPNKVIETPVSYYCPNCKLDKVYDYESEHKLNRCEECGQVIDWSKDEH